MQNRLTTLFLATFDHFTGIRFANEAFVFTWSEEQKKIRANILISANAGRPFANLGLPLRQ